MSTCTSQLGAKHKARCRCVCKFNYRLGIALGTFVNNVKDLINKL